MELYIVADNTLVSNKQCFAHTASPQKNDGVYINVGPKPEKKLHSSQWHMRAETVLCNYLIAANGALWSWRVEEEEACCDMAKVIRPINEDKYILWKSKGKRAFR